MLNVVMLSVLILSVNMVNVIMLSVILLYVVAQKKMEKNTISFIYRLWLTLLSLPNINTIDRQLLDYSDIIARSKHYSLPD
jgi:hypothetical protein